MSYKRAVNKHFKKDDPGYLEFNDFIRDRDASPSNVLPPSDMRWSISEFLKLGINSEAGDELLAKMKAKNDVNRAVLEEKYKEDREKWMEHHEWLLKDAKTDEDKVKVMTEYHK